MDDLRVLTEDEIVRHIAFFRNPKRNWSGMCEAAAFNLADIFSDAFVQSFSSATNARKASKIEGKGFGPAGAWVWMSNVWGTENGKLVDFGHVAYHMGGNLLFMASSSVRAIRGYTSIGFIDGNEYLRRFSNQKLEGWSYDHGGTILKEEDDMALSEDDKKLLRETRDEARGLSQRLDRLGLGDGLATLKQNDDNIGALISQEANRVLDTLSKITTREGTGGRAIYCDPQLGGDGRLVFVAEKTPEWRDFTRAADPWAEIEQLHSRGWCQPVENAHRLNTQEFEYHMRNANRTFFKNNPIPYYLTGEKAPEGASTATPVFDQIKNDRG